MHPLYRALLWVIAIGVVIGLIALAVANRTNP